MFDDARSPSPKNSYMELYQMSTQAMARKKDEMPKKGTPFADPKKKRNYATKWIKEGISFANVVSGEVPNLTPIENKKEDSPQGGGMNETPATNTERAGRRSDPETSWRRSGTNEGRTKKESIAKGEVTVRTDPVSICSRAFGVVDV
ncbi:hypothetical protein TNCV_3594731 [Trichonephila clavipes]|nr:hypothetical protein TNCV_3594731 [Trichonephila clavipes]